MRWLTGGRVLNPGGERFERLDIGVEGERIAALVPAAEPAAGDSVVELAGCWLLPGLIDCHVHLTQPTDVPDPAAASTRTDAAVALFAAGAARRTLAAGVTTARDVGGWNYVEMAVREAIEAGEVPGPRLFLAGRLLSITTATTAYYPGMYEVADGVDEVRRAVRRQLARGADLIKLMATGAMLSAESEDARAIQYSLDELRAAVEVAHANFKPVAAHAHAVEGIVNAVAAGVDSIEHCTFADDDALGRIASAGTFVVPTICAGELLMRDTGMVAAMPEHLGRRMVEFNQIHLATIRRAHELGVRIAMGTDAGTPGNHHGLNAHECVFMATRCGMSPAESIRAATIHGAALLRRADTLGSLEVGKYADVIACAGDPLEDIEELTRLVFVMKGGEVVQQDARTAIWAGSVAASETMPAQIEQ
jgi:imidazolonepropionase-like amidohydrolase